jgi:hypothetical protein
MASSQARTRRSGHNPVNRRSHRGNAITGNIRRKNDGDLDYLRALPSG